MSTLVFFPRLSLKNEIRCAGFILVPYERGKRPGGELQSTYDALLEPYIEGGARPVRNATLLQVEGCDPVADLSVEERDDVFAFAELVAFAGLAAREYFTPFGSTSRDTFRVVIQGFQDPSSGVALLTRRRDGGSLNYVTKDAYRVQRPPWLSPELFVTLDEALLRALTAARDLPNWDALADAMFFFNEANTDSDWATEQNEIVSMFSAFERVLKGTNLDVGGLARRLDDAWQAGTRRLPSTCSFIPEDQYCHGPLLGIWLRDFFKHRGGMGHGRRRAVHREIWTAQEHLLLGAFAFPLLVKQLLSQDGLYALSTHDLADIAAFEDLLTERHFTTAPEDEEEHPWTRIRGLKHLEVAMRQVDKTSEERTT